MLSVSSLPLYILQDPQQRSPHSRLASKSFHWEWCSISKSPVNKPPPPPPPPPPPGPYWEGNPNPQPPV
jgi:hypothetical protein